MEGKGTCNLAAEALAKEGRREDPKPIVPARVGIQMALDRTKRYGEDFDIERDTADYIDRLLVEYQPFLFDDRNAFLGRLNADDYGTHLAAFWEMYLVHFLKGCGFHVMTVEERRKEGETKGQKKPDIRILHEGKTIWIEAVCLRGGENRSLNDFLNPPHNEFEFVGVPEQEMLLRYTTVIDDKQKAFLDYPCVQPADVRIIAVNTGMLWRGGFQNGDKVPRLANILYGIGNPYISIFPKNQEVAKSGYARRRVLEKGEASVSSSFFMNDSCSHISAVLASDTMPRSVAKPGHYDPINWVLARNPRANVAMGIVIPGFEPDTRFLGDDGKEYVFFAPSR